MAAISHTPLEEQLSQLTLRERKKLRTRVTIRRATYRLITEQGYEATTVEQIAEASEVSPSTVFRYFPTKEDIVLTNAYDPAIAAALRARPAGESPLDSLRAVITEALERSVTHEPEELTERTRLLVRVPAVRARMTETMSVTAKLLADVLAERTGRDADDLDLRIFVAAVLSALREVTLHWGEHGCQGDPVALIHRALDRLEGGLRL
ncbi:MULTISPECIES: TetR family transcriptional regulator [unclassified Streptomyces]|uniref:TetR/AcrR family transcriptional regulator n=1 Tax=unclassified Streptomyces TaxID=2593676 RepID=UPI002E798C37|nr:TetR family transcriptional regulator [Streptomyces sp. JV176]MEE1804216.1 TetR family transcriptional regulator [Streptomyces sp. JV176]